MKNYLKISAVTLTLGFAMLFSIKNENSNASSLTEANILLINSAVAEGGTGNTGPGQTVDCAGPLTGSKKICACTNQYDCTESGCS